MKSKTTWIGIFTIVASVAKVVAEFLGGHPVDWTSVVVGISAGTGLIHASDEKKVETKPEDPASK